MMDELNNAWHAASADMQNAANAQAGAQGAQGGAGFNGGNAGGGFNGSNAGDQQGGKNDGEVTDVDYEEVK